MTKWNRGDLVEFADCWQSSLEPTGIPTYPKNISHFGLVSLNSNESHLAAPAVSSPYCGPSQKSIASQRHTPFTNTKLLRSQ